METSMDDDEPITDAEQTRAAALMRMTEDVVAPASLHATIHAMTEDAAPGPARRRFGRGRVFAPSAIALAAIVVAIVIAVAGGSQAPTVGQAARLALAPATSPAPAEDVADRSLLDVRQGGIAFPSYLTHDGWTPTGVRRDTLHGRAVTTVFYRSPTGSRVGYSIVGGATLADPRGTTRTIGGVRYVLARAGGARLVTWWRDGHSCVIAGRSVSDRTLLALAHSDEHAA
jgi:hypothetical protein